MDTKPILSEPPTTDSPRGTKMTIEMRSPEEIERVKNQMEEVADYIKDPCVRSHFDSWLSALRWVLKEHHHIPPEMVQHPKK